MSSVVLMISSISHLMRDATQTMKQGRGDGVGRPRRLLLCVAPGPTRACTTSDLVKPEPLNWMGQQRLRGFEKLHSVRQPCVQFKRSFINPFRMDREHKGFAHRFIYVDAQATGFGT